MAWQLIVALVVVFVAVDLVILVVVFRRLGSRAAQDVAEAAGYSPPVLEDRRANSFGRRSAGMAQVRGTGHLALTSDAILFAQWSPRRLLRIPLADVTAVDTAGSHLGKARVGRRLFRVTWRTEDGSEDQIAWMVKDVDRWLAEVGPGRAPVSP